MEYPAWVSNWEKYERAREKHGNNPEKIKAEYIKLGGKVLEVGSPAPVSEPETERSQVVAEAAHALADDKPVDEIKNPKVKELVKTVRKIAKKK